MSQPLYQRASSLSKTIVRTAPLFPVAVGLILGIVWDRFVPLSLVFYATLFALVGVSLLFGSVRLTVGAMLLLFAAWCVGGMLHASRQRLIPTSSILHYLKEPRQIARLHGTVVTKPKMFESSNPFFRPWTSRGESTSFLLEVKSLEGVKGDIEVTGRIRVTVREALLDLQKKERIEVFGWLYPLRPPQNPGDYDWASSQRRNGVVAAMACDQRENIRRLSTPQSDRHHNGLRAWFRQTVQSMLTDDLSDGAYEERSLLEAMILGQRSQLNRRINHTFIRAGCIHFLAVSGIHVVIVMFLARLVVGIFRGTRRLGTWAMIVAVIAFLLLAEPRPPILRASVIALIYCMARLLEREKACLNWISASAIVLALVDPAMVFDVGYQLSFTAMIGVSYLTPSLIESTRSAARWVRSQVFRRSLPLDVVIRPPPSPSGRGAITTASYRFVKNLRRYTIQAFAVSLGAWLATLPLVALYFDRFPPWGAVNSLLVFPLVTLVMGLGFTKLVAGIFFPTLGTLLAGPLWWADHGLIRFVDFLASFPGVSVDLAPPRYWLIGLYYLFLGLIVGRFRSVHRDHRIRVATATGQATHLSGPSAPGEQPATQQQDKAKPPSKQTHWLHRACIASLVLLLLGIFFWYGPRRGTGRLTVTFLAVGPGSATVIELPEGRTILYDAGTSSPYDVGRATVVPFLRRRRIRRMDRIYISHPNLDHFSGIPSILDAMGTGPVVVNSYFEPKSARRSPSRHLLDILAERHHPIEVLDEAVTTWNLEGVTFELLSPLGPRDDSLSDNDTSTVLRLSYGGHSLLLTGDIENRTQQTLLSRGDLKADILALPHHGSVRASTAAFLRAVGATILIRSSGEPMARTYNGLREIIGPTRVYNTADAGAVTVTIEPTGRLHITTFHPPSP